jgi:quercetin dioxygenase-like cupin family protein
MKITQYQNQEIKNTPHKIDVREMYNKESAQAMLMSLKPGESLKPHKTPVDVFFFIVEGHQQFILEMKMKFAMQIHLLKVQLPLYIISAMILTVWPEFLL